MPIKIPKFLPARDILESENIFVMEDDRASHQDIRPLNILILNLMPEKEKTEAQLLRLLGNTPLQVNVTFLKTDSYTSKNTDQSHLEQFYTTFEQIRHRKFDGMIITGAPIEHLRFEEVDYWNELVEIMDWTNENVTSTLHICWGAQAALYHHYGIGKFELSNKCSGVYSHHIIGRNEKLLRGFDDIFFAPHSRYTSVSQEQLLECRSIKLLSVSEEAGPFIISSLSGNRIMVTGHLEYDTETLAEEFARDVKKGLEIHPPKNYYPNDDYHKKPMNKWRSHAHLLFSNWLNYYVYQETPFNWE